MEEKSKAVLTVSSISLHFGGVKALAEVGFQVYPGEILALIGPNGAGKTCLLNCINGFYRPDPGGSILYQGAQLCGMKTYDIARLGIARVFQGIQTYAGMTTLDNLMTGRTMGMKYGILDSLFYFWSRARKEEMAHRRRVEEIIDFLEIEPIRKKYVGELAYGLAVAYSLAWADVPKVTVVIRKAFGFGGCAMCGYGAKQTLTLAWPTVDFGSIPVDSGVLAAYSAQLAAAQDPEALRKELEEKYLEYCGPYPAAGIFNIDDVIDPRETRPRVIRAFRLARERRCAPAGPAMRWGVMP